MSHLSHHLTLRMKCSPETLWIQINKPLPVPHSEAGVVQPELGQPMLARACGDSPSIPSSCPG